MDDLYLRAMARKAYRLAMMHQADDGELGEIAAELILLIRNTYPDVMERAISPPSAYQAAMASMQPAISTTNMNMNLY